MTISFIIQCIQSKYLILCWAHHENTVHQTQFGAYKNLYAISLLIKLSTISFSYNSELAFLTMRTQ